jgi:hypothetical protein
LLGLFFDAEELCFIPAFMLDCGLFFNPEVEGDMFLWNIS